MAYTMIDLCFENLPLTHDKFQSLSGWGKLLSLY